MGIYNGVLFATALPTMLPRFAMAVSIFEPEQMALGRGYDLVIRIFMPGDAKEKPSIEIPIPSQPKETLKKGLDILPRNPDMPRLLRSFTPILLHNFEIREAGAIRLRVQYGSEALKIGALTIAVASPEALALQQGLSNVR